MFEARFQFSPKSFQEKISNEISKLEQPGLVIIEAPMGLGKTESALEAAEQLAEKTGRSGLLFGLPTQATSNGIFPRINSWLNSVAQDSEENLSIRLVHGKASLNEEFTDIPNSNNINIDESDEGSVFVNQWFSGRKTSALDDFVVATVDQLLMIALKQKHLALRHLGISKKVVVIDEVHAYDAYMGIFLFRAIEYLGAYHVPVVLLSATLPSDIRKNLVQHYMKGRGVKKRDIKHQIDELNTIAYPLLLFDM
ncbi:DEAD/DEAH box helicase family protein [Filifactor alocis]|uniref:DEAD/DEAH box helicase family protein n=1 Tax=Filifactor alocis TaxID=143361 RepID=UPI003FA03601